MTLFQDTDGTAYLIHSTDRNKTMCIARLNDSYTNLDGLYVCTMIDQAREAPAPFFHDGTYYMITSGCTGWHPNAALFSQSTHLLGKWKLIDNPRRGEHASKTFFGQSSFVFQHNGRFYLMLDHWIPHDLKSSGYSILPIEIAKDKTITVSWTEKWNGI